MHTVKQTTEYVDHGLTVVRCDSVTEHIDGPEGKRRTLYSYFEIQGLDKERNGSRSKTMCRESLEQLIKLLQDALEAPQHNMPYDTVSKT